MRKVGGRVGTVQRQSTWQQACKALGPQFCNQLNGQDLDDERTLWV